MRRKASSPGCGSQLGPLPGYNAAERTISRGTTYNADTRGSVRQSTSKVQTSRSVSTSILVHFCVRRFLSPQEVPSAQPEVIRAI